VGRAIEDSHGTDTVPFTAFIKKSLHLGNDSIRLVDGKVTGWVKSYPEIVERPPATITTALQA